MRVWDFDDRQWRDWPVRDTWLLEWWSPPKQPEGMAGEDWQSELDMNGPDLAQSHYVRCPSQIIAERRARRVLATEPNYYGVVTIYRQTACLIESGVMEWEDVGEPTHVEA